MQDVRKSMIGFLLHKRPRRFLIRRAMAATESGHCPWLDGLRPDGPGGVIMAERLRFGPPETWRGWLPQHGPVIVKLWPDDHPIPTLPDLIHPGIARLLAQGRTWRIFDWIAGEPLVAQWRRSIIASGTIMAVQEALTALHGAGLSHGDLTPANVVMTPQGQPVLIDWGEDCAGTPGWRPETTHDGRQRDLYALNRLTGGVTPER